MLWIGLLDFLKLFHYQQIVKTVLLIWKKSIVIMGLVSGHWERVKVKK